MARFAFLFIFTIPVLLSMPPYVPAISKQRPGIDEEGKKGKKLICLSKQKLLF